MKKLIFLTVAVLLIIACEDNSLVTLDNLNEVDTLTMDSSGVMSDSTEVSNDTIGDGNEVIDNEDDGNGTDSTDVGNESYEDEIFEAIDLFRERIKKLSMQSSGEGSRVLNYSEERHSRDVLVPSNLNTGVDGEWLDMFLHVLNFSEEFAKDTSVRGEEVLYADLLDNARDIEWPIYGSESNWGWPLYEETRIVLSYLDDELFLRVIDHSWVQTFIFSFKVDNTLPTRMLNADELIRVFRIVEYVQNGPNIYIEDFLEKTGLTMWRSNGEYFMSSTVESEDGGFYSFWSDHLGNRDFGVANYVIDGVPVHINRDLKVMYDFKYVYGFDSFNDNAEIFLNDEEVTVSLNMNVRPAYHGANTYVLTGTKILNENAQSLEVAEINVITDITYSDIQSNIDYFLSTTEIEGITYDYSRPVETIIEELSDLLYLDYE